ncbi:hypothetical protein ARMGADRAFT_1045769 [Armillaria gallica]|uniref:DUF6570 domain-containing protein n=1 Tax=Armillaria gallica TaxID=47427 RepID=A0A2H3DKM7_ARMGA|nr:hypothetical protein ARMGADRAFT_1045769 [Armillaria gallica]
MIAHAVAFESLTPKIYTFLPPPVEELDDVLAIMFTSPKKPVKSDYKCTPLLVWHNIVARALNWLKLNHCDYTDVGVSVDNLNGYPEDVPPILIQYKSMGSNKPPEATSVFDIAEEDDTESGQCPFIVYGLFGHDIATQTTEEMKLMAMQSNRPESIYNNPTLYPAMFPWLFPYGLGGIGVSSVKMSSSMHKRLLLMYYNKCFQLDFTFPFMLIKLSFLIYPNVWQKETLYGQILKRKRIVFSY